MDDDLLKSLKQHVPLGVPLSTLVDFSVPIAQRLSDLTGIEADLENVEKICKRLEARDKIDMMSVTDGIAYLDNLMLCDSLFDAAVIKYGRIKATGARAGLPPEWISELPPHLKENHQHITDLRNKFIAHPIAPLEDNQVYVTVQIHDGQAVAVNGVTVSKGKVYRGSQNDAACLRQLASTLRARLQIEIELEKAAVLEAARSMPLSDLLKRGYQEFPIPSINDVKKGRKKF